MMNSHAPQISPVRAAIYARVSSDRQAQEQTIASQIADLEQRLADDGLRLEPELRFIDNGHSGSTLVRPALERLRDMAAGGGFGRLYVHSPDRLARNYAYQVLLVDELKRLGIELVFCNHHLSESPEDALLLQVQGVVAEYERTKIMERSRRGRLHAARSGKVSVLTNAPYGYRYEPGRGTGQDARYDLYLPEAQVVRQIFQWVALERLTMSQVQTRLRQQSIASPQGHPFWRTAAIARLLRNSTYQGDAAFGKKRRGPCKNRQHPQRGEVEARRCPYSTYRVPPEHWIHIGVPAIVDSGLFDAVQQQLEHNRQRMRERKGSVHLLRGLLVCKRCGYAMHGTRESERPYGYYICGGRLPCRFPDRQSRCSSPSLRMDRTDASVWEDVVRLLENPQRLAQEYQRRLEGKDDTGQDSLLRQLQKMIGAQQRVISRLIDAYGEGLLQREELEPRLTSARDRLTQLQRQYRQQQDQQQQQRELRLVIGQLETFASRVKEHLRQATPAMQRHIISALVRQIDVEESGLTIVYRVPETADHAPDTTPSVQHRHTRRER